MDLALRPRGATELVDAAFRLFRGHALAFVTLAAVAAVPRLAVAVAQLGTAGTLDPVALAANPFAMFTGTYAALTLVALLVAALFDGAFVALADDALRGGEPTAGRALARGMARAVPVVVTFVVVTLVTVVGLVLFVFPGIYLALRLYSAVPAAVVEGVGPGEALARAWRRTRGAAGRGLVMYLILFVLFVLAGVAASMVGGIAGGIAGALLGGAATGALVVGAVVQQVVGLVLYPLLSAGTTLFYYDTRVRSEALDVELMADALGGPGGGPDAAPAGLR